MQETQAPEAPATDPLRLVWIPAEMLCEVFPLLAAHIERLPNAGQIMRDVGERKASLWAVNRFTPDRPVDVVGFAVCGVRDGAVAFIATSPNFLERHFAFATLAMYSEAYRTGCLRCVASIRPEDAQLAYDAAVRHGAFGLPAGQNTQDQTNNCVAAPDLAAAAAAKLN